MDHELSVTVERVYTLNGNGQLKAFVDVVVAGVLLVKGFRVVEGKQGLFVGMPSQPNKQGKWFDSVKVRSPALQTELNRLILEAYRKETSGTTG